MTKIDTLIEQLTAALGEAKNMDELDAMAGKIGAAFGAASDAVKSKFPKVVGRIDGIGGPKSKEDPLGRWQDFSSCHIDSDGVTLTLFGRTTHFKAGRTGEMRIQLMGRIQPNQQEA